MMRLALDPMDVPAVQAWLEDWAARGWYVESYGKNLVSFARGERQKDVRYRLQPVGGGCGEPDQDTRESYREMGWTYVCSTVLGRSLSDVKTEFHIWRCEDPGTPELDTDQTLREEAYGDLLRRGWRNIWMGVPLIAAVLAVMWWLVWSHPREYLLEGHPDSTILMLCCNVLLTLTALCVWSGSPGGCGRRSRRPSGPPGAGPGQGSGTHRFCPAAPAAARRNTGRPRSWTKRWPTPPPPPPCPAPRRG